MASAQMINRLNHLGVQVKRIVAYLSKCKGDSETTLKSLQDLLSLAKRNPNGTKKVLEAGSVAMLVDMSFHGHRWNESVRLQVSTALSYLEKKEEEEERRKHAEQEEERSSRVKARALSTRELTLDWDDPQDQHQDQDQDQHQHQHQHRNQHLDHDLDLKDHHPPSAPPPPVAYPISPIIEADLEIAEGGESGDGSGIPVTFARLGSPSVSIVGDLKQRAANALQASDPKHKTNPKDSGLHVMCTSSKP